MGDLGLVDLERMLAELPTAANPTQERTIGSAVHHLVSKPLTGSMVARARSLSMRLGTEQVAVLHDTAQNLLLNLVIWDWLDRQATPTGDMGHLWNDVKAIGKGKEREFDASDYLDGVARSTAMSTVTRPQNSLLEVSQNTANVLAGWIGMPARSQEKAWFVRAVLESPLGVAGLRLGPIVTAAGQLGLRLFGHRARRGLTLDEVTTWAKTTLLRHPLCDNSSEHHAKAREVAARLDKLTPFDPELLEQVRLCLVSPLVSITSLPLPVPNLERYNQLVAMLKVLAPFLSPNFTCPDDYSARSRFLAWVHGDSDKLLPFRDWARSRRHVLTAEGPYSEAHVRTPQGFFSALVYRGITHNTDFLVNNKTLFVDVDDYLAAQADPYNLELSEGSKSYFCNKTAYGVPIVNRSVDNAQGFWEVATENEAVAAWLASDKPINPLELYNLVLAECRSFGPLTSFELVMDYVGCGRAETPTVEEMADLIWIGGYTGLRSLGYPVGNGEQVAAALRSLMSALAASLTEKEQRDMGFGLVMVERSLCKLGRLDRDIFQAWYKEHTHVAS